MKVSTLMPGGLKIYYLQEIEQYKIAYKRNDLASAWKHLENAHVLGQAYPLEHTKVHWLMLLFGFRIKSLKEIIGQIPRLLVGGIKSFVGKIPVGNTGGANVPPLKEMEIREDLRNVLKKYTRNSI